MMLNMMPMQLNRQFSTVDTMAHGSQLVCGRTLQPMFC